MVWIKKIGVICMVFILSFNFVSAISQINIQVNPSFLEGEEIKFVYTFLSFEEEIFTYVVGVNCGGGSNVLLEPQEIQIQANVPFQEVYSYGFVDENVQSGDCVAFISILSPFIQNSEKSFKIKTLESFDFLIKLEKKVFLQNQDIHIDYSSSVENLEILATLIYPDGSTKSLNLPTTIKAKQIGTYELEIEVSKQGYKDISLKEQFGVIETEANIGFNQTFYSDDTFNLSTDFNEGESDAKLFENKIFVYILIGLASILILLIIIFFIVKKKKNLNPSSESNMQRE